jgi:hypothetical protein
MEQTERNMRVLANHLRRKLQGKVPSDLLARITDAELVEQWKAHHETRLEAYKGKRERSHEKSWVPLWSGDR